MKANNNMSSFMVLDENIFFLNSNIQYKTSLNL